MLNYSLKKERIIHSNKDSQKGSYLGPKFESDEIETLLTEKNIPYHRLSPDDALSAGAKAINEGKVLGFFNGHMEFGPRALGGRSIIGDPRKVDMQAVMNLKIKFRESFRPFAPSCLEERASDYFEIDQTKRRCAETSNATS